MKEEEPVPARVRAQAQAPPAGGPRARGRQREGQEASEERASAAVQELNSSSWAVSVWGRAVANWALVVERAVLQASARPTIGVRAEPDAVRKHLRLGPADRPASSVAWAMWVA